MTEKPTDGEILRRPTAEKFRMDPKGRMYSVGARPREMDMSGEELYQRYVEANAAEGCDVDDWDDLSDMDQRVWDRMAENLPDMPSAG